MVALPEQIPCKCGDQHGVLILKKAIIEYKDASGQVQTRGMALIAAADLALMWQPASFALRWRNGVQTRKALPSEFEAIGGRGAAKKWKSSIKVGKGVPGFEGKDIGAFMRDELGVSHHN
jgi:SAND domain